MEKLHIEKNTVQETLVIPLFGRKICTERFPSLFQDKKAIELIERIDYDFSILEKQSKSFKYQFGALEVAMRQTDLILEIKDYLSKHPSASIVNLGCGLDQTGENCDNGKCKIYNVDFEDIISIRNQLIPPVERVKNISSDLNDFSWMDNIDTNNGVVLIAAGVFYYFKKSDIEKLFNEMARRFQGGKLVFDAAGKKAVKIMLKTLVNGAGITSIDECFSVDDPSNDILTWFNGGKLSYKGYMLGYNDLRDKSVPKTFRLLSKIADGFMKMKIIRIDFI